MSAVLSDSSLALPAVGSMVYVPIYGRPRLCKVTAIEGGFVSIFGGSADLNWNWLGPLQEDLRRKDMDGQREVMD